MKTLEKGKRIVSETHTEEGLYEEA